MHRISRAPVLSATFRRLSCWITVSPPLLCRLDDLGEPPALRLRQWPRLDDPNDVADLRLVALIVDVERVRAPDDLLVLPMGLDQLDLDDDRLLHRVRDHRALTLLATTALVLGLLEPDDRPARLGLHADRPAFGGAKPA